MKKHKGKLIVIDGTDGSGKTTQVVLLTDRLKKEGYKIVDIKNPYPSIISEKNNN